MRENRQDDEGLLPFCEPDDPAAKVPSKEKVRSLLVRWKKTQDNGANRTVSFCVTESTFNRLPQFSPLSTQRPSPPLPTFRSRNADGDNSQTQDVQF